MYWGDREATAQEVDWPEVMIEVALKAAPVGFDGTAETSIETGRVDTECDSSVRFLIEPAARPETTESAACGPPASEDWCESYGPYRQ